MTWADVAYKFLELIQPYVGFLIGFLLLWLVTYISDKSLVTLIKELIAEFSELLQLKVSAKAINALGILLMFVVVLFLFHGKLADVLLPSNGSGHEKNLYLQGLYVVMTLGFGGCALVSVHITKYRR
jgi:hypothetical protein